MLYSGFYSYSKKHELDLNPQFEELSTNLIMKPELSFNIKELTLIYTYFKKIKFANPRLCNFLKNKMVRLSESTLKPNKVAESAI